jgi:hypothetical protein
VIAYHGHDGPQWPPPRHLLQGASPWRIRFLEKSSRARSPATRCTRTIRSRICRAVIAVTGVKQYNVLENNGSAAHQAIAHVHFHIIPKPNSIEGLGVGWPQQAFDHKAGAELAAKLRTAVR